MSPCPSSGVTARAQGVWSLLWAFPGFCLQNQVGELSPQGGVQAWAWSWWPLTPLSGGVARSTARTGTDPSLRTVFGDGVTPTSLRDRDDAPDGWKPLPLGGCSRPELWGCVCWGWAHSLWRVCSEQLGWPLRLGSVEDRGLQGLGWDRRARRALPGSHRPPQAPGPRWPLGPNSVTPSKPLPVEVECRVRTFEAPGWRSAVGVAVLCPSVEPACHPTSPGSKAAVASLLDLHGTHGALDLFLGTPVLTGAWGRACISFPSLP